MSHAETYQMASAVLVLNLGCLSALAWKMLLVVEINGFDWE